MEPEPYVFDERIMCPWDITRDMFLEYYGDYYRIKYEICAEVAPARIVEIGVRAGYSAYFFLMACPDAFYHGFDADNGTHGGEGPRPYVPWAQKILGEAGRRFTIEWPVDTQKLSVMPMADFYHVDGDHTTRGCLHDIDICFASAADGAVLLVDDYDHLPSVRAAVDEWGRKHPEVLMEYRKSWRGEIMIWR